MIIGTTAAILIGRRRHKRAVLMMNARGARRLSGYPGGHVSMSDADWLSLPRTRTLRSSRGHFGYPPPYTPIASRESLGRHQPLTRPPGARTLDARVPDPNAQQQSWPLPRRLTRPNILPMVHMRGHSLSPVTERTPRQPLGPSISSNGLEVRAPRQSPGDGHGTKREVVLPTGVSTNSLRSDISPNAAQALTPKPLFHNKRRSASFGALPSHGNTHKKPSGLYVVDSGEADVHHARLPRSTSLYAQHAALAPPTDPLPPLPLNVAKLRSFQNIRSSTEHRESGNSLFSGNTSVLDDAASKCFSQAETDLTSTCMTSPTGLGSIGLGVSGDDGFKWESNEITRTASPVEALKKANIRPQLQTQNSFRASIQQSLPRSASSGLSLSLLDQSPFRHPRSGARATEGSPETNRKRLKVPQGLEAEASVRRRVPPLSPLSRNSMANMREHARPKRSSAALQHVSGNQGSPLHDGVKSRPLSVATSDPFKWENEKELKPGKPSALKGRVHGHKRNSCVRISNIPIYIPSPGPLQPTAEEQEQLPQKPTAPTFTFGTSLQKAPQLRPPSRPTFDPQLSPTPKPRSTRLPQFGPRTSTTGDSPTFSLLNLHNPSDIKPSSPLYTPTRGSSSAMRHSGANPNRRKPIFDAPTSPEFVFTTPEKMMPPTPILEARADLILEAVSPEQMQVTKPVQPKPSTTLGPFPSPPHLPPRGPRALPPSAWRRSYSRSPTRIAKSNHSGSWTYAGPARSRDRRGSRDLRKSIIALRRMNSEAQEGLMPRTQRDLNAGNGGEGRRDGSSGESGKGHKSYLSLGDNDSDAGDENANWRDGGGSEILEAMRGRTQKAEGGENRRERQRSESSLAFERILGGPRDMPRTSDGLGGNIFGIAKEMEDTGESRGVQTPRTDGGDVASRWSMQSTGETSRSLYDENGFLKDGRQSPARVSFRFSSGYCSGR